jgi:uracil-DNA glycosylase
MCRLAETRRHVVFGVGNPHAELMFVGEAPGYHEDAQGEPFVGEAGSLLNRMISSMGFKREEVYICNVLKCRPPENRDPRPDEIAACSPFLRAQIESIKPKVIVTLGAFAARTLLGVSSSMGAMRGKWRQFMGIDLMPTFHPAFLLRSPDFKVQAWSDLKMVCEKLGRVPPQRNA